MTMFLIIFLLITLLILYRTSSPRSTAAAKTLSLICDPNKGETISPTFYPTKRKPAAIENITKTQAKPKWVEAAVLQLAAIIVRGQSKLTKQANKNGVRTVAATFNLRYAIERRITISKSYVQRLLTERRYDYLQLCKALRKKKQPIAPNRRWHLDFAQYQDQSGSIYDLVFAIDAGSSKALSSAFVADQTSETAAALVHELTKRFDKPRVIKTDNGAAFVGAAFQTALKGLTIKHQRSAPHSPWQNGKVERMIGTFRRNLKQLVIRSKEELVIALRAIAFHYNCARPHSALGGITPEMAWTGKLPSMATHELFWIDEFDGLLQGYYWRLKT